MSIEINEQLLRQWVEEGWNNGNLALVDQIFSPDHIMHDPSLPEQKLVGQEPFKSFVGAFRSAMPDLHVTVEDLVAQGDKIAWRWTITGTQKGEMMGVGPSGNSVKVTGIIISRFENGLWAEDWVRWDTLGFLQQLGALPKIG
jgi:steroid delta-isomerase-like uncharacterized protein